MAGQTTKSNLVAKLGDRLAKGHESHKADETKYGNAGLPAGIEGGEAQLVDMKFDVYKEGDNKGKYYFYAAGVVKLPKSLDGQKTEGGRTSITEPLCDTPTRTRKTVEDHLGFIYNELRKFGVNTDSIDYNDLETIVGALKASKPTFNFRTWKGEKQTAGLYKGKEPRVQHEWLGICEPSEEVVDGDGVEDDTAATPATEGEDDGSNSEPPSIAELGATADEGGDEAEKAIDKLSEIALELGFTQEFLDGAANWGEVSEAILSKQAEGDVAAEEPEPEAEEPAEPAPYEPKKGDIVNYQEVDDKGMPKKNPRTKKVEKPLECEIASVNKSKKTVDLINNVNKKPIKGVKWDDLIVIVI